MSAKPRIVIYGSEYCTYCTAARMLLKKKGLAFEDVLVSMDTAARQEMESRSGRTAVPQIFIDDESIGGFDELYELAQSGQLDHLLNSSAATVEQ